MRPSARTQLHFRRLGVPICMRNPVTRPMHADTVQLLRGSDSPTELEEHLGDSVQIRTTPAGRLDEFERLKDGITNVYAGNARLSGSGFNGLWRK